MLFLLFRLFFNVMVEKNVYLNGKESIKKKETQKQESNKRIILDFDILGRLFIVLKFFLG